MRLIGLMSWYDEPVDLLTASITGLAEAGVDHMVCVDGAYALYPDAQAVSHINQYAAIHLACRQLGVGCTIHSRTEPWLGNEVEKRSFLFKLGWTVADSGDWFWVMDADMVVVRAPDDLKERLAASEFPAAEVEIQDMVARKLKRDDYPEFFELADLFRAQPISVETHHANYVAEDGTQLWAGVERPISEVLKLGEHVRVQHWPNNRSAERLAGKAGYYTARNESLVEFGDCACGQPAMQFTAVNWRRSRIGPVAHWRETCAACGDRLDKVGRRQLRQLGENPDDLVIENRNGHIPRGMAVR